MYIVDVQISMNVFNEASHEYQRALNEAGYNHKLKFNPTSHERSRKKQRCRNVTWFNPPFSRNIVSNVGKDFFQLIDKSFPPGHILHPVFNRKTVKLSYSCLPNMRTVIKNKNNKLLKGGHDMPPPCNCAPNQCPVDGKCKTKGVVYQATLTTENHENFTYIGLTEKTFLERYQKHQSSFRIHDPRNSSTLSKKVLELQRKQILF